MHPLSRSGSTVEQWPIILNSEHVTRLILLQKLYRLGLVDYSPLDDPDFVSSVGEGGVDQPPASQAATGPLSQKIFLAKPPEPKRKVGRPKLKCEYELDHGLWGLMRGEASKEENELLKRLENLEIYKIELRLLDRFERAVLVKAGIFLEAELDHRRKGKNRWMNRRNHEKARWRKRYRRRKEKERMKKQEEEQPKKAEVGDVEKEGRREKSAAEKKAELDEIYGGYGEEEVKAVEAAKPEEAERPEVELEVIRVGPNPRILVCEYPLLADRIRVHVLVKSNLKFKRGMKFRMKEQTGMEWKYEGELPRYAGRW